MTEIVNTNGLSQDNRPGVIVENGKDLETRREVAGGNDKKTESDPKPTVDTDKQATISQ